MFSGIDLDLDMDIDMDVGSYMQAQRNAALPDFVTPEDVKAAGIALDGP